MMTAAREPAPGATRVLVVLSSLCAEGTPVLTLDLCRHWRTIGVEPTVVTLEASPTDLAPEFEREGLRVHTMDLPRSGRRRFAQMVALARDLCREHRPHALLSMPFGWHAFLAVGARLAGIPIVAAHVGNYPPRPDDAGFAKFRVLVQAGRPLTSKLICCSAYVRQGVVEHFRVPASETEVIYNGADIATIERRAAAAQASHGAERDCFVVGMVARLEIHKDQPMLIRAAKLLRDAGRAVQVWLIGDGSRRLEYERLIAEQGLSDSVRLLGMRRDIPELLGRLDAFVFVAKPDEGQGVALVEAMAARVPIIATDVGACREVLAGGEFGTLVPAGDPGALADAIVCLQDDPAAARRRTELAHRRATEAFSIEGMAESYARCLGLLGAAHQRDTSQR